MITTEVWSSSHLERLYIITSTLAVLDCGTLIIYQDFINCFSLCSGQIPKRNHFREWGSIWAYVLRTYSLSWWKRCGHKIWGVPLRENRRRGLPGSQTSRWGSRGRLLPTRLHLLQLERSSQTESRTENQEFGHRQATPVKFHQHG